MHVLILSGPMSISCTELKFSLFIVFYCEEEKKSLYVHYFLQVFHSLPFLLDFKSLPSFHYLSLCLLLSQSYSLSLSLSVRLSLFVLSVCLSVLGLGD